jgi:hypothetical protein
VHRDLQVHAAARCGGTEAVSARLLQACLQDAMPPRARSQVMHCARARCSDPTLQPVMGCDDMLVSVSVHCSVCPSNTTTAAACLVALPPAAAAACAACGLPWAQAPLAAAADCAVGVRAALLLLLLLLAAMPTNSSSVGRTSCTSGPCRQAWWRVWLAGRRQRRQQQREGVCMVTAGMQRLLPSRPSHTKRLPPPSPQHTFRSGSCGCTTTAKQPCALTRSRAPAAAAAADTTAAAPGVPGMAGSCTNGWNQLVPRLVACVGACVVVAVVGRSLRSHAMRGATRAIAQGVCCTTAAQRAQHMQTTAAPAPGTCTPVMAMHPALAGV